MAVKYEVYSEYKDSGVEWLGEIPKNWKLCKFKFMASIKNGQDYKSVVSEIGFPVIGSGGQFTYASEYMYDKPSVLLGRKGTIDKPLFYTEPFWTVDTMYYTEIKMGIHPKFLYYLSLTIQFNKFSTNTALPSMTQEHLGNFEFSIPTKQIDREKIANFLDHETAKIDALIEKQQELIKLLKEKRQAVISHAVTKGLNPDAPMKDSGVEWLGEVPEGWVICTLRHYAHFIDGDRGNEYPNDKDYKDNGVVFLSSKNIIDQKIDLSDVKYISHVKFNALNRGKAIDGDLIVKVRGSIGRIGELAKFQVDEHGYTTAFINAQMMIIRTSQGLSTNYLRLVSQSLYWTEQLAVGAYGTAQQQLSNDVFSNLSIAVPTQKEQFLIEKELEKNILAFNDLIHQANSAISLMQERRTALISAAVTGKIDVRNWQAPEPSNKEQVA